MVCCTGFWSTLFFVNRVVHSTSLRRVRQVGGMRNNRLTYKSMKKTTCVSLLPSFVHVGHHGTRDGYKRGVEPPLPPLLTLKVDTNALARHPRQHRTGEPPPPSSLGGGAKSKWITMLPLTSSRSISTRKSYCLAWIWQAVETFWPLAIIWTPCSSMFRIAATLRFAFSVHSVREENFCVLMEREYLGACTWARRGVHVLSCD